MSDLKVVEIREDNRVLVSEFLDTIQNSKKKFRYFDNRELECLENMSETHNLIHKFIKPLKSII